MIRTITIFLFLLSLSTTSFAQSRSLKGTWQFAGGIYNGKPDGAPKQYKMQRVYTAHDFNAFAFQKDYNTEKYEAGTYKLKGDTCFETQTYSSRPSQTTGKLITYIFKIKNNNELIFSGRLPSGMVVEEHWKRVPAATTKK